MPTRLDNHRQESCLSGGGVFRRSIPQTVPLWIWKVVASVFSLSLAVALSTANATSPSTPPPPAEEDLFGLRMATPLSVIMTNYQPSPSPFKQPATYLISKPPKPSARFPMVVVTATEETGLCAVSGSFAGERDSPSTVSRIIQMVIGMTDRHGPPKTESEGLLSWTRLAPNDQDIEAISIQTDQLSETITLVSITYRLNNYEACQKAWETEEKDGGKTDEKPMEAASSQKTGTSRTP